MRVNIIYEDFGFKQIFVGPIFETLCTLKKQPQLVSSYFHCFLHLPSKYFPLLNLLLSEAKLISKVFSELLFPAQSISASISSIILSWHGPSRVGALHIHVLANTPTKKD